MHGEGWLGKKVGALRMRLVSSSMSEELSFSDMGSVVVTVRDKGGHSVCKFYRWSVVDGRLQIGTNRPYDQLELLSFSASTVVVRRRSGELASYDITDP